MSLQSVSSDFINISIDEMAAGNCDVFTFIESEIANTKLLVAEGKVVPETVQNTLTQYKTMMQRVSENGNSQSKLSDLQNTISELLRQIMLLERGKNQYVEFSDLFGGFTEKELEVLGKQIAIVQLTTGCSVGCPNCNFSALPKPRRHISYAAMQEMTDRWGKFFKENETFFYYSSDPLDWEGVDSSDPGRKLSYADINNLLRTKCGYTAEITTAVPKGKESLALELWKSDSKVRISPSNVNVKRLQQAQFWQGNSAKEMMQSMPAAGNKSSVIIGPEGEDATIDQKEGLFHPLGKNYDFQSYAHSIGCRQGVYITPDGPRNFCTTATTPRTPNGYISEPVKPGFQAVLLEKKYYIADTVRDVFKELPAVQITGDQTENTLIDVGHKNLEALFLTILESMHRNGILPENKLEYLRHFSLESAIRGPKISTKRQADIFIAAVNTVLKENDEGKEDAAVFLKKIINEIIPMLTKKGNEDSPKETNSNAILANVYSRISEMVDEATTEKFTELFGGKLLEQMKGHLDWHSWQIAVRDMLFKYYPAETQIHDVFLHGVHSARQTLRNSFESASQKIQIEELKKGLWMRIKKYEKYLSQNPQERSIIKNMLRSEAEKHGSKKPIDELMSESLSKHIQDVQSTKKLEDYYAIAAQLLVSKPEHPFLRQFLDVEASEAEIDTSSLV